MISWGAGAKLIAEAIGSAFSRATTEARLWKLTADYEALSRHAVQQAMHLRTERDRIARYQRVVTAMELELEGQRLLLSAVGE